MHIHILPSGRDIFCLKNFDTFTRTSVRVSKMNAIARAQLTFQMLTLFQKYLSFRSRISYVLLCCSKILGMYMNSGLRYRHKSFKLIDTIITDVELCQMIARIHIFLWAVTDPFKKIIACEKNPISSDVSYPNWDCLTTGKKKSTVP